MLSVEPTGFGTGDKELTAVSVGASVCHGEYAGLGMGQLKVLVLESRAVDGFAAGAVMVGEITTLAHEIRYDPVETATLVTEALISGAERAEILRRLGHNIPPQLEKSRHVG